MLRGRTSKIKEFVINFKDENEEIKGDKYLQFNEKDAKQGEIPSVGTYATARSLAKLAAYMANGGTFQGKTLLSKSAWDRFHSCAEMKVEGLFDNRSIFT